MFLEIRRFRWVEENDEARRLLVPATDEAPLVAQTIDAIVQVVQNLDMQLDNTLQPANPNVIPVPPATQDNSGGGPDNTGAGAAVGNNSSILIFKFLKLTFYYSFFTVNSR